MTQRPLEGRRILVTRRREQSSALRERLEALGASVVEAPAIDVVPPEDPSPLDRALARLHHYHWVLFTSVNAVQFVRERMAALGLDADFPRRGLRVGSVGPATSEAYKARFPGGVVNAEPASDYRAEGLLAALGDVEGQVFLLPTSDRARDDLPRTLEARGAEVDVVVAYRTVASPDLAQRLATALGAGIDLVAFASPSSVEGLVAAAGDLVARVPAVVMGPVTAKAARAAGIDVVAEAHPSTAEGLVAAIVSCLTTGA